MVCRKCGYTKEKDIERIIVSKRRDMNAVIIEDDMELLPKTNVVCPKCGHNEAYWILRPYVGIHPCRGKCLHRGDTGYRRSWLP